MSKTKVLVGMSGGVDSSVAAHILKEQGYQVIGVTIQTWGETTPEEDAKEVCDQLGIPHYLVDYRKEFQEEVINYFLNEYQQGRTPNPCVVCNRQVKWEAMLGKAFELGAQYIATGHYARIKQDEETGRYALVQSQAQAKDQTYALYNLTQEQLKHTLMPLGDYAKDETRDIAREIGLTVADKPDSQEICFIPDDDYGKYIMDHTDLKDSAGDFVDLEGNVLGQHEGIIHYTIGQRKGLGIQAAKPLYVIEINPKTNQIVVGDNKDVFQTTVYANKLNFMALEKLDGKTKLTAKIRYAHKPATCTVEMSGPDTMLCTFDEPQRAITPGQAIVLYKGGVVAGGGTILGTVNNF